MLEIKGKSKEKVGIEDEGTDERVAGYIRL